MMKNVLIAVVLLVLAVGGIWYVRGMNPQTTPEDSLSPSSMMPASEKPGTTEMVVSEDIKKVVVEGSEFQLSPATLTLKRGEKVRLIFNNTGSKPHDFRVDELNIQTKVINGGESDTVEFTPDKAGKFEYYCSVGAHRANGMKGTLTVQ